MSVYRHKQIRRFKIGRFQFINGRLRTQTSKDDADFLQLLKGLPKRDKLQIVKVNEEAQRAAESEIDETDDVTLDEIDEKDLPDVKSDGGVVRGPMQASDIKTAKDKNIATDSGASTSSTANSLVPPAKTADK